MKVWNLGILGMVQVISMPNLDLEVRWLTLWNWNGDDPWRSTSKSLCWFGVKAKDPWPCSFSSLNSDWDSSTLPYIAAQLLTAGAFKP